MDRVEIALGPLTYNWTAARRASFYEGIAADPTFDMVYMGETICAKRQAINGAVMAEAITALEAAGRKVVHSTLSLATTDPERRAIADLVEDPSLTIEANDAGALRGVVGRPHHVGPHINVYNPGTLEVLAERGAVAMCLPWEIDRKSLDVLIRRGRDLGMVMEVEVFGKAPLAISARCHHARAYGMTKDGCQYVCDRDAEGMAVDTVDGQPFLTLNGLQTQAHAVTVLIAEIAELVNMGVGRLRLSPLDLDMSAVAAVYRKLLDGALEAPAAEEALLALLGERDPANGFYYGVEGSTWAA
ncbi:ubiquinone anaerobic biosynthesis protein UbiV [Pararhodospirillum oryzae]|uniref:U32 family peptidase n=1 Tax=Pararhodospirillum oryzae TaxID=478448 RepID=A0A512H512_9PROT|nr:U32 family peptidase [Pararhodospirillum oryzae]GEO80556.1 U32 family peptidase [Pararhodospirillum oryzae]